MNRTEHLLTIIAEECAEVAQRCSKETRFGRTEVQPGQSQSNRERLLHEINDLFGVMELLFGCDIEGVIERNLIEAKKKKVEEFLEYSKKCGTLQ